MKENLEDEIYCRPMIVFGPLLSHHHRGTLRVTYRQKLVGACQQCSIVSVWGRTQKRWIGLTPWLVPWFVPIESKAMVCSTHGLQDPNNAIKPTANRIHHFSIDNWYKFPIAQYQTGKEVHIWHKKTTNIGLDALFLELAHVWGSTVMLWHISIIFFSQWVTLKPLESERINLFSPRSCCSHGCIIHGLHACTFFRIGLCWMWLYEASSKWIWLM